MLFFTFGGGFLALFLLGYSQLEKRSQIDEDLSPSSALILDPTAIRVLTRHERWGMFCMSWAMFALVGIIYSIDNVYRDWELLGGIALTILSTVVLFCYRMYLEDCGYRSRAIIFLLDMAAPLLMLGLGIARLSMRYYFS